MTDTSPPCRQSSATRASTPMPAGVTGSPGRPDRKEPRSVREDARQRATEFVKELYAAGQPGGPVRENVGKGVQNWVTAPTSGRGTRQGAGNGRTRDEVHDHDVRRSGRCHAGPLAGVDRGHAGTADEAGCRGEGIG